MNWLGRQISVLGQPLFSLLANVTKLFYRIITTHARKSLAVFTTTVAISVVYSQSKPLIHFLKSLSLGSRKPISEQKITALSQQLSKELGKIQKILPDLENTILSLEATITAITTSQQQLLYKTTLIKQKYSAIKKILVDFNQPLSKTTFCKELFEQLQTRPLTLQHLKTDIQNLIAEAQKLIAETHLFTKDYPEHFNPFAT
jgi:uncharacterized protein YoxC